MPSTDLACALYLPAHVLRMSGTGIAQVGAVEGVVPHPPTKCRPSAHYHPTTCSLSSYQVFTITLPSVHYHPAKCSLSPY
eukprot:870446-Rhodomonas_salina.1